MMHVFIHPKELPIIYVCLKMRLPSSGKYIMDYCLSHRPSVTTTILHLRQLGYLDESNKVLNQFCLNNCLLHVGEIFVPIDKYEFISKYNRGEILE